MVTDLNSLHPRDIHIKVKNGWTISQFCSEYECTADELRNFITRIFASNSQDIMRQLRANAKKFPRKSTSTNMYATKAASVESSDSTENNHPNSSESSTIERSQKLELEIEQVRESLQQTKNSYLAQLSIHQENIQKMRTLHQQLSAMADQLQQGLNLYRALVFSNQEVEKQIHQLSHQHDILTTQIQSLETELANYDSVVICIYSNGVIEALDHPDIQPNDTGYENVYTKLLEQEACENLRISDIRLIARTICATRNSPITLSPLFENEDLLPIFNSLRETV